MTKHQGSFSPPEEPLDVEPPILPYAGTSGWSGTATSRDRALAADRDGTTSKRQRTALAHLASSLDHGRTWRELATITGWHHGQASGVLTILHKAGRIARLTERRQRCRVYVLPEHVDGRETEPYSPRVQPASVEEMTETIREAYAVMRALGVLDDA